MRREKLEKNRSAKHDMKWLTKIRGYLESQNENERYEKPRWIYPQGIYICQATDDTNEWKVFILEWNWVEERAKTGKEVAACWRNSLGR
jgi:hypothetical protein